MKKREKSTVKSEQGDKIPPLSKDEEIRSEEKEGCSSAAVPLDILDPNAKEHPKLQEETGQQDNIQGNLFKKGFLNKMNERVFRFITQAARTSRKNICKMIKSSK